MIETSSETLSVPTRTQQQIVETEISYDTILGNPDIEQAKKILEHAGFTCVIKSDRFTLGTNGDVKVKIEDFPLGTIMLQPPFEEGGQWQLVKNLTTNGPKLFKEGSEEGLDRVTDLTENSGFVVIGASSDKEIARLKFIKVRTHLICAIKAV